VLNTDNINITGESFDYGPWRFLPRYEPGFVAAYFDQTGLYAFGRQPDALAFNLTRLAECLLAVGEHKSLEAALNSFWPAFRAALAQAMLDRLGLVPEDPETDAALLTALFEFLYASEVGYERFFFDWRGGPLGESRAMAGPAAPLYREEAFAPLRPLLLARTPTTSVNLDHPYFARSGPRGMLIEQMEALWTPIATADDWSALDAALGEIDEMRQAYAGTGAATGTLAGASGEKSSNRSGTVS
jgi:uncharacterized protein YdiU (UPF0061 family)